MKRKIYLAILVLAAGFGLMQLFRPHIPNTRAKDLANVPKEVNDLLRKSCYDCHSSEANLRWYDKLTPANFLVASHIKEGRAAFNFANFDSLPTAKQNATLYYALNKMLSNEMPLPSYALAHPDSKLKPEELNIVKAYLISRTPGKISDSTPPSARENKKAATPSPEPNGVAYVNDWRNWTAISTSDRFDNGSMRIIYGNNIAVNAIKNKQINPFPDGAVLVKAAWQAQLGKDGMAHTGQFIQVEFMIKDATKYAATDGWGWGRWKGMNLEAYGKDASFTRECTNCHQPAKDNDYVFTAPLDLYSFVHSK